MLSLACLAVGSGLLTTLPRSGIFWSLIPGPALVGTAFGLKGALQLQSRKNTDRSELLEATSITAAHALFMILLRLSIVDKSLPSVEHAISSGAHFWKDETFKDHETTIRDVYSEALKSVFYVPTAASVVATLICAIKLVLSYKSRICGTDDKYRKLDNESPIFERTDFDDFDALELQRLRPRDVPNRGIGSWKQY